MTSGQLLHLVQTSGSNVCCVGRSVHTRELMTSEQLLHLVQTSGSNVCCVGRSVHTRDLMTSDQLLHLVQTSGSNVCCVGRSVHTRELMNSEQLLHPVQTSGSNVCCVGRSVYTRELMTSGRSWRSITRVNHQRIYVHFKTSLWHNTKQTSLCYKNWTLSQTESKIHMDMLSTIHQPSSVCIMQIPVCSQSTCSCT